MKQEKDKKIQQNKVKQNQAKNDKAKNGVVNKNDKKKEKVKYYDDGRTIADMSFLDYGRKFSAKSTSSSPKDIWNTYWMAVRMMFKPMLVVVGFLCVIFGLAYIFFSVLG